MYIDSAQCVSSSTHRIHFAAEAAAERRHRVDPVPMARLFEYLNARRWASCWDLLGSTRYPLTWHQLRLAGGIFWPAALPHQEVVTVYTDNSSLLPPLLNGRAPVR